MKKTDLTPLDGMSRSELSSRAVCVAATGVIWIFTVFGIAILGLEVAVSPAGPLHFAGMLCVAPVLISTCLGFGVLSDTIHRWLLSLFGLRPISSRERQ